MSTGMLILLIVLAIIVIIVMYVISVHNNLVALRNRVKDQWAQIDVQLKRRFDLIPNLVETVKGYTKHESETLENVIKARNTYLSATTPEDQIKANNELSNFVTKLFALSESYPDLKANTNFMQLQDELKDVENKIASARQFYNDSVLMYNNTREKFPSNIVANIFGFKEINFFKASEKEKEVPNVKF